MVLDQSATAWRRLLDATAILHTHREGSFHERVFLATRLVFGETCHGFESFGHDGSHEKAADIPWPESRLDEFVRRSGEVVPLEHPMFPLILAGETRPMRLSDFVTNRQLARTSMYNDLWKPVDVRYQVVMPLAAPDVSAALIVLRGDRDFSDEEIGVAQLFARQVNLAWETSRILEAVQLQTPAATADHDAFARWRLSPREGEVLTWVAEGKRNSEIAIILGMSPRTVEVHLTSIYRKLGVENRASAVAMLRRR